MSLQIIIYRGTHEIGGSCVELRTELTRIILDVGMPLVDESGESFDARSMDAKTVPQLKREKTIPKTPGLFEDPEDKSPSPAAILLSHAHCDHTGLLKHTRQEIPVWLSPGTSDMMYVALKFANQISVGRKRQRLFTPGEPFQVGDFTVTAYPVDHSAFDSMAFLIEAEGKRVLYSGAVFLVRVFMRPDGALEWMICRRFALCGSWRNPGAFGTPCPRFRSRTTYSYDFIDPQKNGVRWELYKGACAKLPDFTKLKPSQNGRTVQLDLAGLDVPTHDFSLVFTGIILIPQQDEYTFFTSSNDGSQLYIDDKLIVNNDGEHGPMEKSGSIRLAPGKHRIRVTYFQSGGSKVLKVHYKTATTAQRILPGSMLFWEN